MLTCMIKEHRLIPAKYKYTDDSNVVWYNKTCINKNKRKTWSIR
jgi:hypothetical protein